MRRLRLTCLSMILLLCAVQAVALQREDKLSAAFIVNFIKYTQWPDLGSDQSLLMVVDESEEFVSYLQSLSDKAEALIEHPIRVLAASEATQEVLAQVYYHGRQANSTHIPDYYARQAILTISYVQDAADPCSMIMLFARDNKMAFQVNHALATQAHLVISSKLLQLSRQSEVATCQP